MSSDLPLALLVATISKVLAEEAKEWMVWLPAKLIRWASRQFHARSQDRIEEEWLAHCNDLPGSLAKVLHALGCVLTAVKLTDAPARIALMIIVVPVVELAAPLAVALIIAMAMLGIEPDRWPESVRAKRLRRAAGGFVVLGLGELETISSDYYPRQQLTSSSRRLRFLIKEMGLVGQVYLSASDRAYERYSKFLMRFRISGVASDNPA